MTYYVVAARVEHDEEAFIVLAESKVTAFGSVRDMFLANRVITSTQVVRQKILHETLSWPIAEAYRKGWERARADFALVTTQNCSRLTN